MPLWKLWRSPPDPWWVHLEQAGNCWRSQHLSQWVYRCWSSLPYRPISPPASWPVLSKDRRKVDNPAIINLFSSYAVQGKIGCVWAGVCPPKHPHPPTNCVSPIIIEYASASSWWSILIDESDWSRTIDMARCHSEGAKRPKNPWIARLKRS